MSQHIVALQAANVKRIKAFRAKFDKDTRTIILSGENAQGKSSVLDCICMALCGKEAIPGQPIRAGEESAEIVLETEELIIRRTFTASDSYLTVSNREGFKTGTPQQLLESMIERVAFDPLQFSRMDHKKQSETLLKIFPTPIDLNENAVKHSKAFAQRAELNRETKKIGVIIEGMRPTPEGTPDQEISIDDLSKELSRLRSGELQVQQKKTELDRLRLQRDNLATEITRIEAALATAKQRQDGIVNQIKSIESQEYPNYSNQIEEIQKKLQSAETTNRAVRAAQSRKKAEQALADNNAAIQKLNQELGVIRNERDNALREAKFPVPGLSIGEDGGVTLNGIPFDQSSTAEQIRVGIAIGAAANNKLRVCMIRDASLLDSKSMAIVAEMAEKLDLQIWMERVDDKSPAAIQIVDGTNLKPEELSAISTEIATPKRSKKKSEEHANAEK